MDKLLQEAIADAKSVRETALANAKIALEEAFTPHLKSMLSKKLQAEMEGEDEESHDEGYADEEEEEVSEEMDASGIGAADNKEPEAEASEADAQGPEEEGSEVEAGKEDEEMEETDQPMGENMEDEEMEEPVAEEMEDEDEDLEEVLRQLEAEMADEDEEPVEEPVAEMGHMEDEDEEAPAEGMHDDDEDIDLDEIIKALTEEDDEEEVKEEMEDEDEDPMEAKNAELEEYKQTVQYLKDKLSEVNLLNAKLLYTNKLFRSRNISESQKMKVIEQFDRTSSVREVKLVYSTFAESIKRKPVNESKTVSKASKTIASTKSKKPIIGENTDFKSRMKKLANII